MRRARSFVDTLPHVTSSRHPAPRLHLPCDRFLSGLAARLRRGPAPRAARAARLRRAGSRCRCSSRDLVSARKIAAELERANASYGHPRARELAQRFADPDTLVVVAGQQAGLFGGPLYTLTKMAGRGAGRRASRARRAQGGGGVLGRHRGPRLRRGGARGAPRRRTARATSIWAPIRRRSSRSACARSAPALAAAFEVAARDSIRALTAATPGACSSPPIAPTRASARRSASSWSACSARARRSWSTRCCRRSSRRSGRGSRARSSAATRSATSSARRRRE